MSPAQTREEPPSEVGDGEQHAQPNVCPYVAFTSQEKLLLGMGGDPGVPVMARMGWEGHLADLPASPTSLLPRHHVDAYSSQVTDYPLSG